MKNYLYAILFIAVAFSACSKASSDTYETSGRSTSTTTTSTTSSSNTSVRGTTPGTTTAAVAYAITFNNANQIVKVTLSNKTLNMNFYENINLYVRKDSLAAASAIIFTEDFKATQLGKFHYTSVGKSGAATTDFVESNLNNVAISATKDTTIGSIAYTKVSFNRNFIFSNTYTTSTEAATEYDYMLNNSETVNFAAYLNLTLGKTAVVKSTSKLVYSSN